MPRHRPATSGYARLSQADDEEHQRYTDDSADDDPLQTPRTISTAAPQYAPIQPRPSGHMRMPSEGSPGRRNRPGSRKKRGRSNSSVDIKAINARLERWADEIASKFKIRKVKGKSRDEEKLEIHHTVFTAPEGVQPLTAEALQSEFAENQAGRMTKEEFDSTVESVRTAIELGMHPKMISKGSSGSYFARNTDGKVVGVFKPKDEEPYATRNPKWTKWIHRNLFPCFFGRACLIPNLSYVSEAAAYVLDCQLRTNIVPYTDIVHLSSKAFYYDFWQRSAFYRKRKPLPEKPGSFQVFLKGYKDATEFLREHPWPDQVNSGFRPQDAPKSKRRPWTENCRATLLTSDDEDEASSATTRPSSSDDRGQGRFFWTDNLQQSLREELEKLVVLDYIMRNTDRGLDNWMIKVNWASQEASIVSEPPKLNMNTSGEDHPVPVRDPSTRLEAPYKRQEAMTPISGSGTPRASSPTKVGLPSQISLGAIDNSLSWPWKHPDAWRSFPFGWLFLPVSLIGRPFSQRTRDHFLPLLTSKEWWSETQVALRRVFEQDSDFKERMFARQIAVMKGQAWNVVETLKTPDHGPLELTRRTRVCVWDDLVDIPVAIPLRTPSAEMRRQQLQDSMRRRAEEDEMDISSVQRPNGFKVQEDLLKFTTGPGSLPSPNRFALSRNSTGFDSPAILDEPETPATIHGDSNLTGVERRDFINGTAIRPSNARSKTRVSFDTSHRKHASFSGGREPMSARFPSYYDGDDGDGDLGYAAAQETENNTRKVIVERLEAVQSKNPVFTWC